MRFSRCFATLGLILSIIFLVGLFCSSLYQLQAAAQSEAENSIKQEETVQPANDSEKPGAVSSPSLIQQPAAGFSPEAMATKEKASKILLQEDFSYRPDLLANPFVPFIKPPEPPPPDISISEEDEALPPELKRPLTPLQKMNIGEIERGLKAIVWGELGRKAIIQDSAGKGYIVSVGTPAGSGSGVISQIFDDRLVIQQEVWDGKLKRFVSKNEVVKLRKVKTE